jgi:hypothetical protein
MLMVLHLSAHRGNEVSDGVDSLTLTVVELWITAAEDSAANCSDAKQFEIGHFGWTK